MKKTKRGRIFIGIEIALILVFFMMIISEIKINNLTGEAISGQNSNQNEETHTIGPTKEEQACISSCVSQGCEVNDMNCRMNNSEKCLAQCNADKPAAQNEGQSCMETCVVRGCEERDFECQGKNRATCENECNMLGDAPDKGQMSEEQMCITNCVAEEDPNLRCKGAEGGETGNEVCQRCAKQCEYLYAGPCLTEAKLEEKKSACVTCEHCYGSPIMGDSGEGYECIIDVECKDASSEFGDEPGTGEGVMDKIGSMFSTFTGGVVNFFKGMFGGEESSEEQITIEKIPETP